MLDLIATVSKTFFLQGLADNKDQLGRRRGSASATNNLYVNS